MKNLLLTLLAVSTLTALVWVGLALMRPLPPPPPPPPATTTATSSTTTRSTTSFWNLGPTGAEFSDQGLKDRINALRSPYSVVKGRPGYWRLGLATTPRSRPDSPTWWFLSPEGNREFLNTVTTVQPFQAARDTKGANFISRDYDGGLTENGDLKAWAEKTLVRVQATGFKGLGAWCNPVFHSLPVPMTRDLNLWKWVNGDGTAAKNHILLYSPDWQKFAEAGVLKQVTPLRQNHNLVGYYIDNELEWGDDLVGPRIYFDNKPASDPNRQEVIKVVRRIWPEVAAFNRDWGTSFTAWADLDALPALPLSFGGDGRMGNYSAYIRLLGVWMEHAAREYFRITTSLIRKHDPNHLILGVRFKNWAPVEIVRASREYTDAQSLNYYVGDARLDKDMFEMMNRESGNQPVVITEYSFHALDGRSGNRNTVGFAAQVLDQRARAEGYRLFTTRLARVPWVVGADWFQWADEPPSGRYDGEDVNFGIVDVDDRAYEQMERAVRETAPKLNDLHAGSAAALAHADPYSADLWRESYATRPTVRIPHLTLAPVLNGELSDWPTEARIPGVRASQTLGLERSRVPLPNVYAGWRAEGLYLAFEVFDDDIQGADPKGLWWTRDCVEWWLSTRPIAPTQSWYDGSCHQFFFVPREFPDASAFGGASGVVGRWHRPGDAVQDNLIPDPNIRVSSRVFPGRYVAEILIPPTSLNGWNPTREPRMGFNIHIRNWQHATDYFWSAPKEMQTQLRPGTWGTMYLTPAPAN